MKRIAHFLVLSLGLFTLCGCAKSAGLGTEKVVSDVARNTDIPEGQTMLDLNQYTLESKKGTDDSPGFAWRKNAGSDKGYYYWKRPNQLMFFDIKSEQSVPLCNRPDCDHTDKDCNSYFASLYDDERVVFNTGTYVQFVNDRLYVMGIDDKDYVCLYEVAQDGSTREKCMCLYKADFSSVSGDPSEYEFRSPELCIHRGYVYWIDSEASPLCVHRMKLGGKKDEVIYTEVGENANTYRLEGYGDFIFFQSGHFVDEGYNMNGGIYAYNTVSGEIQLVLDKAISSYMVENNKIYYATESGASVYDLVKGQSDVLVENEMSYPSIMVDENYLYCYDDENYYLFVYEHDGELISELRGVVACDFGDSRYVFGEKDSDNDELEATSRQSHYSILSIEDLVEGKANWIILN